MLVLSLALLGCGTGSKPPPEEVVESPAPATDTEVSPQVDSSHEAAAAVQSALKAVGEGRPDLLWDALPPSYAEDVTGLVHAFGSELDPTLWSRTFSLARRTSQLARDRKSWILSHPTFSVAAGQPSGGDDAMPSLAENWEALCALVDMLAASDLADAEKLSQLNVRDFLGESGRTMVERVYGLAGDDLASRVRADLGRISVEPADEVDDAPDRARLRIGAPGFGADDHTFVRVEGRWIPESIQRAWPDAIAGARSRLEQWSLDAPRWRRGLDEWDRRLTELEQASDETEFHSVLDAWLAALRPEPELVPIPEGSVTVEIPVLLDPASEERLQLLLNGAAGDPDLAVSIPQRRDGKTLFTVSHTDDVAAFAERLGEREEIAVKTVDADGRRVVLELRLVD